MRSLRASQTLVALFSFVVFLSQVTSFRSNKFGLSHNCAPDDLSCGLDVIYCVDSKNSSAVCNITCTGLFACSQATFVVANSGGLVLNCLGTLSCQSSTIEWVNSDNLHNYTAVNSSAAIGGPLRVLYCYGGVNGRACDSMSVNGDTQEQGLGTTTEWHCAGYGSCQRAEAKFKGAVSIHCNQTESCLSTNVTCLSGGNCRTKSNKDTYSVGATMHCMPGVQHCECGNYWDCITLTAAPIPTSTRIPTTSTTTQASVSTTQATTTTSTTQTTASTRVTTTLSQTSVVPTQITSITETPHSTIMAMSTTAIPTTAMPSTSPGDDKGNSNSNDTVIFVVACVIILVVSGLLAALGYLVFTIYFKKESRRRSEGRRPSKDTDERAQLAKKKDTAAVSEAPRGVESMPIGGATPGGPRGVTHEVICLYESDEEESDF